jgi:hypothetical protein
MANKNGYTELGTPPGSDGEAVNTDRFIDFCKDPEIRWRIAELIAQAARGDRGR